MIHVDKSLRTLFCLWPKLSNRGDVGETITEPGNAKEICVEEDVEQYLTTMESIV